MSVLARNVNKTLNKRWIRMQAVVHVPTSIVAVTPLLNIMLKAALAGRWWVTEASLLSLFFQSL